MKVPNLSTFRVSNVDTRVLLALGVVTLPCQSMPCQTDLNMVGLNTQTNFRLVLYIRNTYLYEITYIIMTQHHSFRITSGARLQNTNFLSHNYTLS